MLCEIIEDLAEKLILEEIAEDTDLRLKLSGI